MKVKEFIELLNADDMEKELSLYFLKNGERIDIEIERLDFNCMYTLDINVNENEPNEYT